MKTKSQTKSVQKSAFDAQAFDAQAFLDSAGIARRITEFPRKTTIFAQGDPAKTVMYIKKRSRTQSVRRALGLIFS